MTHLSNMQILKKSMWLALASEAADGTDCPTDLPPNLRSQKRVSSKQAGYSTPVWTNYRIHAYSPRASTSVFSPPESVLKFYQSLENKYYFVCVFETGSHCSPSWLSSYIRQSCLSLPSTSLPSLDCTESFPSDSSPEQNFNRGPALVHACAHIYSFSLVIWNELISRRFGSVN